MQWISHSGQIHRFDDVRPAPVLRATRHHTMRNPFVPFLLAFVVGTVAVRPFNASFVICTRVSRVHILVHVSQLGVTDDTRKGQVW